MKRTGAVWILIFLFGPGLFAGCASMESKKAAGTEDFLVAAGFTKKVPATPQDQANLQSMKPLKMVRTTRDGQVKYVYPDPYHCRCVYVGNEKQYAEYRRLSIENKIAEENVAAAEEWQFGLPPFGWYWWW